MKESASPRKTKLLPRLKPLARQPLVVDEFFAVPFAPSKSTLTKSKSTKNKKVDELVVEFGEKTPLFPCDVSNDDEIKAFFENVRGDTDRVDLMLHSLAFAPREALEGEFVSTTREAFRVAHDVSAYSLVAL